MWLELRVCFVSWVFYLGSIGRGGGDVTYTATIKYFMHTPGFKLDFFQLHRGTLRKTLSLVCVIFPVLLLWIWVMSNTRNAAKLCFIDTADGAKWQTHTSLHYSCARRALTQSKSWKGLLGKVVIILEWFPVPSVHLFVSCHSDSLEGGGGLNACSPIPEMMVERK